MMQTRVLDPMAWRDRLARSADDSISRQDGSDLDFVILEGNTDGTLDRIGDQIGFVSNLQPAFGENFMADDDFCPDVRFGLLAQPFDFIERFLLDLGPLIDPPKETGKLFALHLR